MERLTRRWGPEEKQISGHAICEFNHCPEDTTCASCVYGQKNNRLADIEDILGDNYDLDRLKELVEADREGRIKILPKSTENTCGTCKNFLRIEGTKRGRCKLKPLVNSQYGMRYNIPFEPSQSRKACKNYESALKAMKERENDG